MKLEPLIIDDLTDDLPLGGMIPPEIVAEREYQTKHGTAKAITYADGTVILQSPVVASDCLAEASRRPMMPELNSFESGICDLAMTRRMASVNTHGLDGEVPQALAKQLLSGEVQAGISPKASGLTLPESQTAIPDSRLVSGVPTTIWQREGM